MKLFKLLAVAAVTTSSALFAEETAQNIFVSQDFENTAFFQKASANGYTARDAKAGQWAFFKPEKIVSISNEQAASGEYSLKYVSKRPNPYFPTLIFNTPLSGSFEFECYVNTPAKTKFVIGLVTEENGKKLRNFSFGSFDNTNNLAYLDFTIGKWKRSGIKFPVDEWVLCKMKYDNAAKKIAYFVNLNDKEEKIGEITLNTPIDKVLFIEFRHNMTPADNVLYVDDVRIIKK